MSGPLSSPSDSKLPNRRSHRSARAMLIGIMVFGGSLVMASEEIDTSLLENEELAEYRRTQIAEIERHAAKNGSKGESAYFCTVYYTPKEGGFTATRGFDVTPTSAPGLGKRRYAAAFLRAVKLEGYGKLVTPVNRC